MANESSLAMVRSMQNMTLGILGGGQLGRMSAMAAARLGIRVIIYSPEENSPASQVSAATIIAPYDDQNALQDFAVRCDVISYEFENIPVSTVKALKNMGTPVFPDENLLEIAQDRLKEKAFLNEIGIPTARWTKLESQEQLDQTLQKWDAQAAIIKTARLGYDGKGQFKYKKSQKLDVSILENIGKGQDYIIEDIVPFKDEISVITARDHNKNMASFGPMLNQHKDHILDKTFFPAPLNDTVKERAIAMAENLATKIDLRGLLTLELFLTEDDQLLANEIAPRTHNSGHWSIDACACSQFENHVRAVCALPALPPQPYADAQMLNLIGEDAANIDTYLTQENACIHLYGKDTIKPGRKMGHITFLNSNKRDKK